MGKQNNQLLKNIREYEKKKAEQHQPKVLAKKQTRGAKNKKENINVRIQRRESLWSMVRKQLKLWSYQKQR